MQRIALSSVVLLSFSMLGCATVPVSSHVTSTNRPSNQTSPSVTEAPNSSTNLTSTSMPTANSSLTSSGSGTLSVPSNASQVHITAKHVKTKTVNITYPQLSGLPIAAVETKLNADLRVDPAHLHLMNPDDTYTSSYKLMYAAGDLLEIDLTSYDYPQGAAHGEPAQDLHLMNLRTGQSYTMKDFFRPGSQYLSVLSQLVREKDTQHVLDKTFSGVTTADGFALTQKGIQVFFAPYEWAPYAAGFPTFDISYDEVKSITNTSGSLWKALQLPDTARDLTIQRSDVSKVESMGFKPVRQSPTDTQLDDSFTASNTSDRGTLYAFFATKGSQGKGNLFFFLGNKYLGTDTQKEHDPIFNLYPDGEGSVVADYTHYAPTGVNQAFTMRFTWNGGKLKTNHEFPKGF